MRILELNEENKNNLLNDLLKRNPGQYTEYEQKVKEILENVKQNKDKAVFDYTLRFDGISLDAATIRVTEEEIKAAYEKVDTELLRVIRKAIVNIKVKYEFFNPTANR